MIKFNKIIQRASKRTDGGGRTSTLLLGAHGEENDAAAREEPPQFEEAARETPGVDEAAPPTPSGEEQATFHEPADEGRAPEEPGAAPDAGSEDATVSDDLVNRVLDDIFEEESESGAADEVEFVEGSGPGEVDELAAAANDLIDTADEDAAGPTADQGAQDTEAGPPHAEAAESPPATGEAEAPDEAAPATPTPEETDGRAASGGEKAEPSEGADDVSAGQEIADLVDEISRMDESMSRTLQGQPRQEGARETPAEASETAKSEEEPPPPEAEPADVQQAEAAGDEAPENKREEESAEEAPEPEAVGDSVMAEVDRLLSELGQISVPGQASGESPEEDSATVTAEEREALLDEEAEDAEDIAESVSSEVDEAVGAVKMLEEGGAEIEIDFTPEAVGIEDDSEKEDQGQDEAGDVDDMLSSLLSEIDKLDVPGQSEAQEKQETQAQTQDEDFSGLLGGGLQEQDEQEDEEPSQEPPEEAPEEAAPAEPPEEQPEPDENSDDEQDWNGYDMADDLGFTEDELVSQALAQALGTGEDADDVGEEAFEDDNEDTDGGDDADAGGEGEDEEASESETDEDDTEVLLKNLEDSMDAAAEEKAEDAGDDERNENDIQAEVVARSRDVEQAVLDELFGTGTEDFEREIKTELASMDDRPEDAEAESAPPKEETTEPEAEPVESAPAEEPPHRVRLGLLWLAYQMNRPFMRWLNPARLRSLALLAIGLLSTGLASLAVALALLLKGK